nr:MAG TPA: hypothetical protein [Caudoviricetes sp.]
MVEYDNSVFNYNVGNHLMVKSLWNSIISEKL